MILTMMKFAVIFLLSSAVNAIPDPCATAHELNNGDGKTEYFLKYRVMSDEEYNKAPAQAFVGKNGTSFGYRDRGCKSEFIVPSDDSIGAMKVKVEKYDPEKEGEQPGFRVLTSDENRYLSWNQLPTHGGHGYYMYKYDKTKSFNKLHSPFHTKFVFKDEDKSLSAYAKGRTSGFLPYYDLKVLGYHHIGESTTETSIYGVKNEGQENTRFCFQKITKPVDDKKQQELKKMIEADKNANKEYAALEESEKEHVLKYLENVDTNNLDVFKKKFQEYFKQNMENKIITIVDHAKGENAKKFKEDKDSAKILEKILESLMKKNTWKTVTKNDVEVALKENYEGEKITPINNKKETEIQKEEHGLKKHCEPKDSAVSQVSVLIALVCLLGMN